MPNKIRKPNFLFLMVDEMRTPPCYETPELKKWREKNLKAQELLRTYCMDYRRHYAASTACAPSRTTLFTGQYPSLHGVSQTTGMAKSSHDPDVYWLDPSTVPTMGDYFEVAGYQTYYKGKWHISDADIIIPGTTTAIESVEPITGFPNADYTNLYYNSNRLDGFGFNSWIGPEPHGGNPINSGASAKNLVGGRDPIFAEQVVDLIHDLETRDSDKPWLLIASFVNPHDITLYGDYAAALPIYNFEIDQSVPFIPPPPTYDENLESKPLAQQSYKLTYPLALQPNYTTAEEHRRLYYSLEKKVDSELCKVLKAIISSPMYRDTIIIFTSDHGDTLGSHGLYQKWHNVYEESLGVPLVIHSPVLFDGYNQTHELTSHVDILPTMLSLAGINFNSTQKILSKNHSEARDLVGKVILPIAGHTCLEEPIYFLTTDQPTSGLNQVNAFTNQPYNAVIQPNNIEAVITYLASNKPNVVYLYKYARYFDPNGVANDQYEMYNVTKDPLETRNLINNSSPKINSLKKTLQAILDEQRHKKQLKPTKPIQNNSGKN